MNYRGATAWLCVAAAGCGPADRRNHTSDGFVLQPVNLSTLKWFTPDMRRPA